MTGFLTEILSVHPQSLRDSPLLRGATPIRPLAGGPVACPQACSLIGNSM